MARIALLVALVLATVGLALWGFGAIGPRAGEVGEEPGGAGAAPDLATAADGSTAPTAARAGEAGLSSGAPRVVARSRPPTVDGPRITGRVTDRAGKGIREARVLSIPDTATKPFSLEEVGTDASAAFDAVTDAEGRFAVSVTKDAPYHAVVAEAAGFGSAVRQNLATYAEVTIVLQPGAALAGTVTDAEGQAVVGARVRLYALLDLYRRDVEASTGAGGAYRLEGLPTVGPPSGSWGTGVSVALEVTAEGFAPLLLAQNLADLEPGREKRRDFVLVRGASVRGRVLDAEGDRPVPGARVLAWSAEGMGIGSVSRWATANTWVPAPWVSRRLGETTSDAEGRYAFDHFPSQGFHPVPQGTWGRRGPTMGYVVAIADGYVLKAEDVPVGRSGATWEIDLRLRPGALVAGRIVDGEGKPVRKATVAAEVKGLEGSAWLPPGLLQGVPTSYNWEGVGEDGRYRLAVPCERSRPVDAKVTGRFPTAAGAGWKQEGDGNLTVSVTAGATIDAPDLVLGGGTAGPVIEVVVRTEDGRPAFGAMVSWEPFGTNLRTDAAGHAALPVPSGDKGQRVDVPAESRITVRAPGYATARVPVTNSSVGGAPIEVTLKAGRRLTGRVVKDDGTPAAKGRVIVADGNRPAGEVFPVPGATRAGPAPAFPGQTTQYGGATAGQDGRFVVEDLPDGPYHVAAWPASAMGSTAGAALLGLLSDVPTGASDVEVRLPPAASPPTGGLEGRIVDVTTKRPVPGAVVSLQRPGEGGSGASGPPWSISGRGSGPRGLEVSPGLFEMTDVLAGAWTVSVTAEGYRPVSLENVVVRANETTKVGPVEMDRGVRVRGRLRVPEGSAAKDRMASFSEASAPAGKARYVQVPLEPDGTFVATGFTPGTWRVMSWKQGWSDRQEPTLVAPIDQSLVIRDGEIDVSFDANLVASGTLSIQPTDERLPPAAWRGGTQATDAQTRFGEAARLVVKDAAGNVVGEQKGLSQNWAGAVQSLLLVPGRFVVRYEAPGDEAREETVVVKANEVAMVQVTATGMSVSGPQPPGVPRIK